MKHIALILTLVIMSVISLPVYSHCEVPCGIYGDETRIKLIKEHITTVEKSMKKIVELSAEKDKNYNQLVRWIDNKETHANEIQHIVTQYFMTQRIKVAKGSEGKVYTKYVKEISLLHEMLVYAMKSKQSTDLSNIEKMRKALEEFEKSYFKK